MASQSFGEGSAIFSAWIPAARVALTITQAKNSSNSQCRADTGKIGIKIKAAKGSGGAIVSAEAELVG